MTACRASASTGASHEKKLFGGALQRRFKFGRADDVAQCLVHRPMNGGTLCLALGQLDRQRS